MADVFTPEQRSALMSRIRGRDTRSELVVRSMLHRLGYRFTVRAPNNRQLPGRPDLVLPKFRTVVFVHDCFWHGVTIWDRAVKTVTRWNWLEGGDPRFVEGFSKPQVDESRRQFANPRP